MVVYYGSVLHCLGFASCKSDLRKANLRVSNPKLTRGNLDVSPPRQRALESRLGIESILDAPEINNYLIKTLRPIISLLNLGCV